MTTYAFQAEMDLSSAAVNAVIITRSASKVEQFLDRIIVYTCIRIYTLSCGRNHTD